MNLLSNDFAYVLGVSFGDGSVRVQSGHDGVTLDVNDKDFALEFKDCLKNLTGREPYFRYFKTPKRKYYVVRLYSKDLAETIHNFGFKSILFASSDNKCSFLRGLFDSEGGIGLSNLNNPRIASRHIGFYNNKKELIKVVSKLLTEFNIKHKINTRVHSGYGSKKLQYEIIITGLENFITFHKMINFTIKRKQEKLNTLLKSYIKRSWGNKVNLYLLDNKLNKGNINVDNRL